MSTILPMKSFRFGVQVRRFGTLGDLVAEARTAEDLGYSVLCMPDHLGDQLSPLPALTAAAISTGRLRVGTYVLSNDFRHPVEVAREAATLDLLWSGRFELGIGAGWLEREYGQAGITYDAAPTRIARLEEAIHVLKGLFAPDPFTFRGTYYSLNNMNGLPKPVQSPHLPVLIGGGGKRVLSLAAREADIVSLAPRLGADGNLEVASLSARSTLEKIEWIHAEAGTRLPQIELNIQVYYVVLTEVPVTGRAQAIEDLASSDPETSIEFLTDTPHALIGTVDEVVEQLQSRRQEYGISYITVQEQHMESLGPVIAGLGGT